MPRTAPARPEGGPVTRALGMVAFAAALVLVLGVPFVWQTLDLDPFRGPKTELALAAWATLAVVFAVSNLGGRAWRDGWWLAWAGVAVGALASVPASTHPLLSLGDLVPLLLVALGWGALRQLSDARRAKLSALVMWAGVIEAVLVLTFRNPAWQPASFSGLVYEGERYAFSGTLGNPADVAVFLILPALLATEAAMVRRRRRTLHSLAAILLVGTILATRTLSAVAALVVGLAVLAWRIIPARRRVTVLGGGVALLIALVVLTPLRGRVGEVLAQVQSGRWLWLGSGRGAAITAAAKMIAARPLTGVGFAQFGANSFRFESLEALAERGRTLGLYIGFGEAHNDLLQYAAETGLLGVLVATVGIAVAWRRRGGTRAEVGRAVPLLAAGLVVALSQFPLHLAVIAAQWAVVAAALLPPLPPAPVPARRAAAARLVVALCLAAGAAFVTWQRFDADVAVGQAKLLVRTLRADSTSARVRTQIARAALTRLQKRVRWLPGSWRARLVVGNLAAQAGDFELALESFGAALALAERPEVELDTGLALTLTGEREAGMTHLIRAVKLNPAIFREISDPTLARALRRRLDAIGYGKEQSWMYEDTPAADP
jgi:tetratricopeptide (TPR) repeat protein